MDLNDGKRVWDGFKSKLGLKARGQEAEQPYDEGYYADGYDPAYEDPAYDPAYEGYDDGAPYGGYDEVDRYAPEPRSALPRLVSMEDARASARRGTPYQAARSDRFSNGRDMYDSSLPYEMTPAGSAAASARGTRRYEEGFVSPYEAADASRHASAGYADEALSRASGGLDASSSESIKERTSASLAALRERIAASGSRHARPSAASAPASEGAPTQGGPRKLTVIKPIRYGEADRIPAALKRGDVVVLALTGVTGGLDKRILDFSFGVASSLDAEVECVADKVFVIAQGSGLTDSERASLQAQGVL